MSTMQTELYDALIEAGATEDKARAAATAVSDIDQVATKADVAEIKTELANLETGLIRFMVVSQGIVIGLIVGLIKLL